MMDNRADPRVLDPAERLAGEESRGDAGLFGSIEAGGTKFVCGVGNSVDGSRLTTRIATTHPDETLAEVVRFFRAAQDRFGPITAFGVGSFGPLVLDPASPDRGQIQATPKPHWAGVNIGRIMGQAFGVPAVVESDVNAAALAEAFLAPDRNGPLAYVTVGTGIGVGLAGNPDTQTHASRGELGHLPIRRHAGHGDFAGVCPFHGDCAEGLASGPAFSAFWGLGARDLPPDHPAWAMQAWYLAQICAAVVYAYRPGRIVLGGGMMDNVHLLDAVRDQTVRQLNGYVDTFATLRAAAARIVAPACREPSGLIGGYRLAERAARGG